MDVIAGQPIGRGDHDQVKFGQRRMVPQPVQPRPAKTGAAVAVVAVDVLLIQLPAVPGNRRAQPVKLLLDGLRLGLAGGRHPRIHRHAHQAPPRRSAPGRAGHLARPSAPAAGRPDPTGARRRDAGWAGGRWSRSGSSGSPARATSVRRAERRKRSGRCHQFKLSRIRRTQQNLPFVIRPSRSRSRTPSSSSAPGRPATASPPPCTAPSRSPRPARAWPCSGTPPPGTTPPTSMSTAPAHPGTGPRPSHRPPT